MAKQVKTVKKYELSEQEEKYILLYIEYFVFKNTWNEICKKYNCTQKLLETAIKWTVDHKLKIPTSSIIKGSIDAIENRIKLNRALYDAEIVKKKYRDNGFIIALTKEIREDEKMAYRLQEIYQDPEQDGNLTPAQVLGLIKANKGV
jgi:hypothetical protein